MKNILKLLTLCLLASCGSEIITVDYDVLDNGEVVMIFMTPESIQIESESESYTIIDCPAGVIDCDEDEGYVINYKERVQK